MALQEAIHSDTTLSDFSAVLLRKKKQSMRSLGEQPVNISPDDNGSPVNRNLSSVLSQIQDDGPAYTDSKKQRGSGNWVTEENEKSGVTAGKSQAGRLYDDDMLSTSSTRLQQEPCTTEKPDCLKVKASPGILLQLLLLICVAALLSITLFKFDVRADNLEKTLNIFDEKIKQSEALKSKYLPTDVTEVNEALQSLQQELQLIKSDYSLMDEKYVSMITDKPVTQAKNVTSIQDNVSVLKYEMLSLKSELQAVKDKLKITNKNATGTVVASSGLTVILASLTNKNKAEEIVEQLYADGLLPSIKQAVVKGKLVYRLTVSGFLNRDEAEIFIRKAGKKYGMKDGLIRKS
jgi:hypothetical protein